MPTRTEGGLGCELVGMGGFLAGLSLTVATVARFVLWNLDEFPVPIYPACFEVCDLAGSKTKPIAEQADESRRESARLRYVPTGLQQAFELPVIEHILVRVVGGQCVTMPLGPSCVGRFRVTHSDPWHCPAIKENPLIMEVKSRSTAEYNARVGLLVSNEK